MFIYLNLENKIKKKNKCNHFTLNLVTIKEYFVFKKTFILSPDFVNIVYIKTSPV